MPFFVAFLIQLAISAALFVVSELLRPKPDIENARPAGLGDFRVATATEGRAVSLIWGTVLIDGPNVIWYGDLKTIPIKDKIKTGMFSSKHIVTGFKYQLGLQIALCQGTIDGIRKIVYNKKHTLYNGAQTLSAITFNNNKLFGGDSTGGNGGFQGIFQIHSGAQTTANAYLTAKLGATRLPSYEGTAHIVLKHVNPATNQGAYIGDAPQLHQFDLTVSRFPNGLGLTSNKHIIGQDANPMAVVYEILTDPDWGLGLSGVIDIDATNFRNIGDTLFAEGNGFSLKLDTARNPVEIINEIERQIDGRLYMDVRAGQFKMKLARNDYVIGNLPVFNESNILELKNFARADWRATSNEIRIPFEDSSADFKSTYALAQDGANYEIQGIRRMATHRFPGVKSKSLASDLAWRELRSASYPLAQASWIANRTAYNINPGDVVAFSWADHGISLLPMRVAKVDYGRLDDGRVTMDLVQDVFQNEASAFTAPPNSEFVEPVQTVTPLTTDDQLAIELPLLAAKQQPSGEQLKFSILVAAHDAGGSPYRYEMRQRVGAGAYISEGFNDNGLAFVGTLRANLVGFTNAMPAQGAGTFQVDQLASEDLSPLVLGNHSDSDINATFDGIAVIEPGTANEEWIIYRSAVVNGAGIELSGVIRGALDSVPRAHSLGARIWFMGEGGFSILPEEFAANNTVDVKLMPESPTDTILESEAITMNVVMPAANLYRLGKPYPPNELRVNGALRPASPSADFDTGGAVLGFDFLWTRRDFSCDNVVQNALGQDDASFTTWSNQADGNVDLQFTLWLYDLQSNPTPAGRGDAFFTVTSALGPTVSNQVVTREQIFSAAKIIPNSMRVEIEAIHDSPNAVANNPSRVPLFFDCTPTSDLQTTQSVDLDGSTECLANTTAATLGIGNVWTVQMWVKPTSTGVAARSLLALTQSILGGNDGIVLDLPSDAAAAEFRVRLFNSVGTAFKTYGFGSYTPSAWTQLTVTWDGTTLKVYQDGVEDTTPTLTLNNAGSMGVGTRRVVIGVDAAITPNQHLQGLVHRVSIWNVALSAAAVTATYNAGDGSGFEPRKNSGSYTSSANLQHCWDWRLQTDIGRDYGFAGTLIDVGANAVNIAAADLSNDQP